MDFILQSKRLDLRKITKDDFENLCNIMQDIEIMYAWEHAFTDIEVTQWIEENIKRYNNEGHSYFAAIEKATGNFIGVIGPLMENVNNVSYMGVGYILDKKYWGMGYAFEGAKACVDFAFSALDADKVIAEIRPENLPSRKVAEKLGMNITGEFIKPHNGKDMPHLIYSIEK